MKNFIAYLTPRIVVLVAILIALKLTIWPTLSFPAPPTAWFDPIRRAAYALKQAVTPAYSNVAQPEHSQDSQGVGTASRPFVIDIQPAGSEPYKPAKISPPTVVRTAGSPDPAPVSPTSPNSSRVASSKQP